MMTDYLKSLIKILYFTTCYICFSTVVYSKELNQIQFLTDESPPYSFIEGGKLQGISVDLLTLASEKSNSPISIDMIKLLPWPRAYRTWVGRAGTGGAPAGSALCGGASCQG
jgi:hypothetical protein